MKKKLKDLLAQFSFEKSSAIPPDLTEKEVSWITSDSREVTPQSIFVGTRGLREDGHDYLNVAAEKGALLVVGERPASEIHLRCPYIQVSHSKLALAQLAAQFYDHPSQSLLMIGVTGTSGKTTTTYLIESILSSAGYQVGVIGTINCRYGSHLFPSQYTTPGAVETQRLLSEMKKVGCNAVVMEVSSHALKQNRIAFIAYDAMIFTNLSPEHLDYHLDMEDYFSSKAILFKDLADYSRQQKKTPVAIINTDDPYGERLATELEAIRPSQVIHKFGLQKLTKNLHFGVDGTYGTFNQISIQSNLVGQFNGYNILAAVTSAQALGLEKVCIEQGISHLDGVPGRLEKVENPLGIHIWVDYAHKPDALQKVLNALKEIQGTSRLITVFGCGGDRDRQKRPMMGKIAVTHSSHVWITSDNPRTEEPLAIIQEILEGIPSQSYQNFSVEPNRKTAIQKAIFDAKKDDLVLIAGKGHEDYQIIGTNKVHFDDREVVQEAVSLGTMSLTQPFKNL